MTFTEIIDLPLHWGQLLAGVAFAGILFGIAGLLEEKEPKEGTDGKSDFKSAGERVNQYRR